MQLPTEGIPISQYIRYHAFVMGMRHVAEGKPHQYDMYHYPAEQWAYERGRLLALTDKPISVSGYLLAKAHQEIV